MLRRRIAELLVGCCVAASGVLVTACYRPPGVLAIECCKRWYTLEVVNEATEEASVRIGLIDRFRVPREDGTGFEYREMDDVIMHLDGNETRTFTLLGDGYGGIPDSAADNDLVRYFDGISFFRKGADRPYEGYWYATFICVDGRVHYRCEDEMLGYGSHFEPPEAGDRLFVESPTRPFYLERDKDNLDLARIVITFVPSAESGSGSSGEQR